MLSPATSSSSTQVTQGAPAPSSLGPQPACTGPRVGQGRTSSLRCGRSTLTNACGPEPHATRALTDKPTQVTRAVMSSSGRAERQAGVLRYQSLGARDLAHGVALDQRCLCCRSPLGA